MATAVQQDSTSKLRLGSPLANRFSLNFATSQHVEEYVIDLKTSVQRLNYLLERAEMMTLYAHYFPEAYAASLANDRYEFDRHSSKEWEFIGLLPTLFPFPEDFGEDELLYGVPVMALGYDHWNLQPEDYSAAGLAIATLLGQQDDDTWDTTSALHTKDLSLERLDRLCAEYEADHPLRGLGTLVRSLDFQSENPFLDSVPENYNEELEWTQDNLDYLIEAGKEIVVMQQLDRSLSEWLEADPQHWVGLVTLWNRADRASEPMLLEAHTPHANITTITAAG